MISVCRLLMYHHKQAVCALLAGWLLPFVLMQRNEPQLAIYTSLEEQRNLSCAVLDNMAIRLPRVPI